MDMENLLKEVLEGMGLTIDQRQERQLLSYVQLILDGLSKQRLVGTKEGSEIISKHICDCLYPMKFKLIQSGEILDLGTGAGLPGIPIKIFRPEQIVYLMDSNGRKMNFLQMVSAELGLEQVYYLPGRAEQWAREQMYRERFDFVVTRAVAEAAALVELAMPLTKVGGTVLLYKGPRGEDEMADAEKVLLLCGGALKKIDQYRLPSGEERTLISLLKVHNTPGKFPRRNGIPVKKPILSKNN